MGREQREVQLAYVSRYRKAFRGRYLEDGQYRNGPIFPTYEEAEFWAQRKREELLRRANGEVRAPTAFYKTISLHCGDEPEPGEDPPRIRRTGRWLPFPRPSRPEPEQARTLAPEDVPAPAVVHLDEPRAPLPTNADASGTGSLETLDSVVHDFVASLDQATLVGRGEGASSQHAERFRRLLEHSPSTKSHVLGPPVLFGASPSIGLDTLLGLLGSLRKTGILRVRVDDVMFMVSIVRGDVVHGVSYPRPETELLGNILVARGTIDADRLERFLLQCRGSASRIAEALERQELVSTDALKEALEHQLQLLFDRLLSTRESEWCFHEGEATLAYINMRMNVISVLLESARKNDERMVV